MPPRPSLPTDDLYARLEVRPDASYETIEIAWRALLKRHHPDIAGHENLEVAKRINVAHDWLSDPDLRDRYDRDRRTRSDQGRADRGRPGRTATTRPTSRAPAAARPRADPATAVRRFVDRVGRLSRDELDRLSVADTNSIAFVASIRRFLDPVRSGAIDAVERDIRVQLSA